MSTPEQPTWGVVVPVKGGRDAKSRLDSADRLPIALAMAVDTVEVAVRAVGADSVAVVTSDPQVVAAVGTLGPVLVVADGDDGLDAAAAAGVEALRAAGHRRVAVLLGDHPALATADLEVALGAAARHTLSFVPDADGEGTALLATTDPGAFRSAFGAGSAVRHRSLGAQALELDLPRLRQDVDDLAGLDVALALGVGARTRAALLGYAPTVQASIHTLTDDGGSALLDDGREVTWDLAALAGSGLRHVRVGQRVSVELADDEQSATRLWIVGIGEGERIR